MKKIVVYDSGWGGELVADYLAEELKTVEIIRIIDWPHAPYGEKSLKEIEQLALNCLKNYIGKVDAIVLGGYACSCAYEFLQKMFPEQAFVKMDIHLPTILHTRNYPRQICALMNNLTTESSLIKNLTLKLSESYITIPNCQHWDQLIDDGEMTTNYLRKKLASSFELQPPKIPTKNFKRN